MAYAEKGNQFVDEPVNQITPVIIHFHVATKPRDRQEKRERRITFLCRWRELPARACQGSARIANSKALFVSKNRNS